MAFRGSFDGSVEVYSWLQSPGFTVTSSSRRSRSRGSITCAVQRLQQGWTAIIGLGPPATDCCHAARCRYCFSSGDCDAGCRRLAPVDFDATAFVHGVVSFLYRRYHLSSSCHCRGCRSWCFCMVLVVAVNPIDLSIPAQHI